MNAGLSKRLLAAPHAIATGRRKCPIPAHVHLQNPHAAIVACPAPANSSTTVCASTTSSATRKLKGTNRISTSVTTWYPTR